MTKELFFLCLLIFVQSWAFRSHHFVVKPFSVRARNVQKLKSVSSSAVSFPTKLKEWSVLPLSVSQNTFRSIPTPVKTLASSIYPVHLSVYVFFQYYSSSLLRSLYQLQLLLWKFFSLPAPYPWDSSILGFVEERCSLFSKLIGFNYFVKISCLLLGQVGFRIASDFPSLLSRLSYMLFFVHFLDQFKSYFLKSYFPSVSENRRQNYIVNRSLSFAIWVIGGLTGLEMVSSFLKVPLSSTLAFGGVGGLVLGLSARDTATNFLGGLLLLFNEPFTPGDMVTFKTSSNTEFVGRVERVGWCQTRIRGRDTTPTYIPNSHFIQTAVTNMERITHRKYETIIHLRHQVRNSDAKVFFLNLVGLSGFTRCDFKDKTKAEIYSKA
jgi:small-conductance mechanosensitive channel